MRKAVTLLVSALVLGGCAEVWNDPYPASERGGNILYTSFVDRPKTLDPARSYTSDEWGFIQQIYEPPLQYHYLKRPYQLIPQTAVEVPKPRLLDAAGRELPADAPADRVATSEYVIRIQPGILYQPHPAFAKDAQGRALYLDLPESAIRDKYGLSDFPRTGTRELVADDYVYQIKRLANPRVVSPIFGHMSSYIVGLKEFGAALQTENQRMVAEHERDHGPADKGLPWIDLRKFPLSGVDVLDRYTYRIRIKGKYPQFVYWLAMPFFAPMPVEADRFYSQRGMNDGRNLTLDWFPVGTGPYMLVENNPNARMVLARNPNFRGEAYPSEGEPGDAAEGLLRDAGKTVPFIDRVVFTREKEGIPYWNKFLQGYYDQSGISSDNFDQAVRLNLEGEANLTPEMQERGISLRTSVGTSTFYLAFNFLDPVVGGPSARARKLRQAISIAMDWEEFISIFQNGRGIPGTGPIPPGIFGYREGADGVNPVVYEAKNGTVTRKPISAARKLLAEAGYPDGRDARTGQPLVLYLDTVQRGPGDKPRLDWYRRQFAKLNIQLEIRATDWNRFQEKIRGGNTQLFFLGWNADYPDPENFMFLLNGPQSRAKTQGENAANYQNPEYDRLFERMKNMDNGPARQAIIDRMVAIVREDAPWVWGFHPLDYSLAHDWLSNLKPNQMARNGIKYLRIDTHERAQKRREWNQPVVLPIVAILVLVLLSALPAVIAYRRRERAVARPARQAA
ncbi:MAG: ABC transporter substrate-binding protein [Betaproteobacteria bacterium]|jgi:ABC-type transport system substrate-binding protein|nr:ABC transporter substrate-binding protein [Betaproteobacteria bacterium]